MSSDHGPVSDPYAATAGAYDLFNAAARAGQMDALRAWLPLVGPRTGPVLDVGAGSGLNVAEVLERVPGVEVLALEPSAAMRSLLLTRIAARPDWYSRVTVRPEDFFSAPLPQQIGGAVLLGVLGHFDPGERLALLAELADRLPVGGAALIDLQAPESPRRIEPFEFTAASVGQLTYKVIGEAWPHEGEVMRWRMSYLTLEGERVLVEETTEHRYRHPAVNDVVQEATSVGLALERLGQSTFWMLRKVQA